MIKYFLTLLLSHYMPFTAFIIICTMKKILVPTDFSLHAENALRVAAQIAKENNSEIILLHMLELPRQEIDLIGGSSIPEIMLFKKKAFSSLEKLANEDFLDGIKISEIVQFEKAFDGILEVSRKNDVNLIVMGSHGSSGFQELFIGSNTEKVVRISEVPVLIIKNRIKEFKASNLVFASDFSSEIKKPFQQLVEFARIFNSHLNLVMINTPNSFRPTHLSKKIMTDFMDEFGNTNYSLHVYSDSNIEKGILNFANSIDADLIGMCTHGRTGFARFFNGSISEDLVNHAVRPVITFKT